MNCKVINSFTSSIPVEKEELKLNYSRAEHYCKQIWMTKQHLIMNQAQVWCEAHAVLCVEMMQEKEVVYLFGEEEESKYFIGEGLIN